MNLSLILSFTFALLVQVNCQDQDHLGSTTPAPAPFSSVLEFDSDILSFTGSTGLPVVLPAQNPVPYSIITQTPPVLLTTCSPTLEVDTYIAGSNVERYNGYLPVYAQSGWAVLQQVYSPDQYQGNSLILVDGAGNGLWANPVGYPALPICSSGPHSTLYAIEAPNAHPMQPMGTSPLFVAIDPATGDRMWQIAFDDIPLPVDITLLANPTDRGLLSIQLGYEQYLLAAVDLEVGVILKTFQLAGQPAYAMAFPGAFDELILCKAENNTVAIGVSLLASGFETWQFNLDTLELNRSHLDNPVTYREYNQLDPGGSVSPGPIRHPFPQQLLPVDPGNSWLIEALVDSKNQVFVVTADGGKWVDPTGLK